MKTRLQLLFALVLITVSNRAQAQGTAFTYQGVLSTTNGPANGLFDLTFAIFNASSGGAQVGSTLTTTAVGITNGTFSVVLDFGAGIFTGPARWLELSVRTNGGAAFATLTPRQPILPVPYAITASNLSGTISASQISGTLPAGSLTGTYGNPLTLNNAANSFSGNGAGLVNVNAATVGGLAANSFWKTNGNSGTSPANGNFVGTSDNQPLELRVNGARALRLEPNGSGTPNLIGGYSNNVVNAGVTGATIAGGGGNGQTNGVTATGGTVGGGANNSAGNYGTVPGGFGNTASGQFSLAAGFLAQATNLGTFVWADAQLQNFTSTANDQFLIRALGGVGIGTNNPAAVLHVSSGTGPADPQLRLDQTAQGDFSRLRFLSSTNAYWDVAVGGGAANVMNWFVSGVGNLMTLLPSGDLSVAGTVTATTFSGSGALVWQVPAGTSVLAQPNTGYLLNNAALVTLTLPASPPIGAVVRVSGGGTGGWRISQNAGQSILGEFSNGTSTTTGTGGYLTGGQLAVVELQFVGSGQFVTLSQEGTIAVH